MKKILLLLLITPLFLPADAQQQDSLKLDTLPVKREWFRGNPVSRQRFKPAAFIAPAALITYGFVTVYTNGALKELDLSTKAELQEDHPRFAAHLDDYIQFAPAAALYVLNLSGVKGKHNLFDASMIYVTSAAIMGISTHFVKNGVGRTRPDWSANNSFPSGHTASAFMAAEFLYQEYREVSPWIGYGGYFVATATGALRLYNNKHWFSDVVGAAGFGIASTKIAYLIYPYIKQIISPNSKNRATTFMPFHTQGVNGLSLAARF